MFITPENISAASKASIEKNVALLSSLTSKYIESVEQVVDLNITSLKQSLEESNAAAKQFFAAKDAQEFFALATAQTQPNAEKAIAYGRNLAGIAATVGAEISKVTEAQIADTSAKVLGLVEELTKNAPAGSENVVGFFKSAIGNASAGYEQFNKSAKQAAEVIETNLNNAVSQFAPAAKAAKAKKAV
ncbi:TIGR01841 family phasin [Noviherbaspirillum galbum]|uniref:TIGR01841 family phasin n=1 Tax=Noviherbaspirillum galbum TaxID=2709383 RepID=A0A6B3SK44_9BURK|nr:TIGR01841 family phasin [Noviherbaspirillum galbum]NEX61143.1 TIGR01841 family phasin [Noviherbaspirillum galbum]